MELSKKESVPGNIKTTPPEEVGSKDDLSPCVPGQTKTSTARVLTKEELDRLSGERALVSDFKQMKLEKEAQKNWDLFYKRNTTNFFKDRHWTTREFEELKACREVRKRVHVRITANICMRKPTRHPKRPACILSSLSHYICLSNELYNFDYFL